MTTLLLPSQTLSKQALLIVTVYQRSTTQSLLEKSNSKVQEYCLAILLTEKENLFFL